MSTTKKKISQETFDEVVQENIDDFEMSKEEALLDTIKQFQIQGVDMSGIDTTGGIGLQEVLDNIANLQEYVKSKEPNSNSIAIVSSLKELSVLCADSHTYAGRNQTIMNERGGVNALHDILRMSVDAPIPVILNTIDLIIVISKKNIENRDFFEPGGSLLIHSLLTHTIEHLISAADDNVDSNTDDKYEKTVVVVYKCFRLIRLVSKTEYNKCMLFKAGIGKVILNWLNFMSARVSNASSVFNFKIDSNFTKNYRNICSVTTEACMSLKGLCIHDDTRKEMSCAYENGKYFLNSGIAVPLLSLATAFDIIPVGVEIGGENDANPHNAIAAAALTAAKQLITSEESVQVMAQHGAMGLPLRIYTTYLNDADANAAAEGASGIVKEHQHHHVCAEGIDCDGAHEPSNPNPNPIPDNAVSMTLLRAVTGVMRNLCADDRRKNALAADGTLVALMRVMSRPECLQDVAFSDNAIACLAMITLRAPSNAVAICKNGVCEFVLKCMYYHMNKDRDPNAPVSTISHAPLLRQGCLLFRNIAARCPPERDELLANTNVENVLKQVGTQYKSCVDEAYGALRDFGIEIKRVMVNAADGSVGAAYEAFGEGISTNKFNPVFDSTTDINRRMQEESRAPFVGGTNSNQSSNL